MNKFFVYYSLILTIIIFIPLYRVVKGPTIFDRMLGVVAIGNKTMVLVLTTSFVFNSLPESVAFNVIATENGQKSTADPAE